MGAHDFCNTVTDTLMDACVGEEVMSLAQAKQGFVVLAPSSNLRKAIMGLYVTKAGFLSDHPPDLAGSNLAFRKVVHAAIESVRKLLPVKVDGIAMVDMEKPCRRYHHHPAEDAAIYINEIISRVKARQIGIEPEDAVVPDDASIADDSTNDGGSDVFPDLPSRASKRRKSSG